jgi:DNA gyrase/topoisomerase IV subunit B
MRGMTEWSKNSPQDLQKIAKFIKDIAENRAKQEAGKAKIAQKYQSNALTNLPSKYLRPLGKDHIELFIVEGDESHCL